VSQLGARVLALLEAIAPIGQDPITKGYRRHGLTEAGLALEERVFAEAADAGLVVSTDSACNRWAWWGDPDAHPQENLVLGSHLDSVPNGGPLDGPLGVLAGLAVIEALRAEGVRPRGAIGLVSFFEEEGSRFGVACLGSRVLTGVLGKEAALGLRDREGTSLAEALRAHGIDPAGYGPDPRQVARIGTYLELHVEQGHQLRELGAPVGLATGIWPHGRWRVVIEGRANHAGTTLLEERVDPLVEAAQLILWLREEAIRRGALATVGRLEVQPNAVNAIPERVALWVDARAPKEGVLEGLLAALGRKASPREVVQESRTAATAFDETLRAEAERLLGGVPAIDTGAGHDAGILAEAGVRAGMLFVRNPSGVSHAPNERAEPADIAAGAEALLVLARALA
jgi:N-carbamoyl-L-amino-acid hydrolase